MDVAFSRFGSIVISIAAGFVASCYSNMDPNHGDTPPVPAHRSDTSDAPDAADPNPNDMMPGGPVSAYDSGPSSPTGGGDAGVIPPGSSGQDAGGDPVTPTADAGASTHDAGPSILDAGASDACTAGNAHVVDPTTGHCYMYFRHDVPFLDAKSACTQHAPGGHLATITSTASNVIVTALIPSGHVAWIGLWAPDNGTTFSWIVPGVPLAYTHWAQGEPTSLDGHHCVEVDPGDNGWKNAHCPDAKDYVCEAP
jgi:hypothetical protein